MLGSVVEYRVAFHPPSIGTRRGARPGGGRRSEAELLGTYLLGGSSEGTITLSSICWGAHQKVAIHLLGSEGGHDVAKCMASLWLRGEERGARPGGVGVRV